MTACGEKKIKVSIVIPVYNSANTIERCLKSVVDQTYDNIEILIIDDGSIDGTLDIIKTFDDSRVYIIRQAHSGVSAARNNGIKKSSGKYLMFLDSDDALDKNAIETLVKCAQGQQKDTVIRFGYVGIDNGKKKKEDLRQLDGKTLDANNEADFNILIKKFFGGEDVIMPCYSVVLFLERKYIIECDLFFNSDLYMMEDMVFYLDLFRSGKKVYFLNKPLYLCYINNNSATRSQENAPKMLNGAINSSTIILKKLNYNMAVADNCFNIIFRYIIRSLCSGYKINKELDDPRLEKIARAASVRPKMSLCNSIYFRLARKAILSREYYLLGLLAHVYKGYNVVMKRHI